jgi:LmbE family N-acetylglucosaminyl deacetylase
MSGAVATFGRVLAIAPHPDDEVLGAGGTLARLAAEGGDAVVAVVTAGRPPAFDAAAVARVRAEALAAHADLGVRETLWLDQPAAALAETPHAALNAAIAAAVREVRPDTLLVPFLGDIHRDHQATFESALVAARPHGPEHPTRVYAYETLSETNWNAPYLTPGFLPHLFVDIGGTLERKLAAMGRFASQLKPPPHERSLAAVRALATLRGATVHRAAAEAFVAVRHIL